VFLLAGSRVVLAQDASVPSKPFHRACSDGDIEQLKLHLANKADVNKADERGNMPLRLAAEAGATEAVKLLLDAGAQVNAKGPDGRSALINAAQNGHKEVVDVLLAAGADVKAKELYSDSTSLHFAAPMGHKEIVEALIKAGADVNAEDRMKQTPLMLAQRRQQLEMVDLLKAHGAKEPVVTSPYGDDGLYGQAGQGTSAPVAAATRVEVKIDPNAIRDEVKAFEGLAPAIKAVDDKNDVELKGWMQRRLDNRTTLLRAAEKQFGDELAFVKKVATEEKAQKTIPAIDELIAKRKDRNVAISEALREERRTSLEQNTDTMGMGRTRGGSRTVRGRGTGTGMQTGTNPYGNPGATMSRVAARPEPNKPPIDGDTQSQIQAWVSGKPESKDTLLQAVHELDLAELEGLRMIATEEAAKKTAATISGLMLARQLRVDRIAAVWKLEDERQQKLQERMGTQTGTYQGTGQRGMRGTTGQNGQSTTGRGRRYR
jgi:hypothetical protein